MCVRTCIGIRPTGDDNSHAPPWSLGGRVVPHVVASGIVVLVEKDIRGDRCRGEYS